MKKISSLDLYYLPAVIGIYKCRWISLLPVRSLGTLFFRMLTYGKDILFFVAFHSCCRSYYTAFIAGSAC